MQIYEDNRVEYKGLNIGRRDILETVNKENVYLWQLFMKHLYEKRAKNNDGAECLKQESIKKYLYKNSLELSIFFVFLYEQKSDMYVLNVSEKDAEDFIYFCKKDPIEPASVCNRFYNFLIKEGIAKNNPFIRISKMYSTKNTLKSINFINDEQIIMLDTLPDYLKLYFKFSLSTASTSANIRILRWEHIDFDKRIANIENITLYFNQEVLELLKKEQEYREKYKFDDCGYVFRNHLQNGLISTKNSPVGMTTISNWCSIIGNIIGIPNLRHTDIRHTAIYKFLSATGSVGMTSIIMNDQFLSSKAKALAYRGNGNNELLQQYKDFCEI